MQTFLPHPDFKASAKALDWRRLGKQRVEALQVLQTLAASSTQERRGWRNHPTVKMWRGYENALAEYGIACCDEWLRREYADTTREKILALQAKCFKPVGLGFVIQPPWLGDDHLHSSHRATLLWKADVDFTAVVMTRRDWANSKQGQDAAATLQWYKSQGWKEEPRYAYYWPK